MFLFVLRKIASNRWKVLCLLAGSILVVAMLSSIPIYTNGTLQRLLVKEMEQYQLDTAFYPGYYVVDAQLKFSGSDTRANYMKRVGDIALRTPSDYVHAPATTYGRILEMGSIARKVTNESGAESKVAVAVKNVQGFEQKVEILQGRMYNDAIVDGVVDAVVTERFYANSDMAMDQIYDIYTTLDSATPLFRIRIVGIVKPADSADLFWYQPEPALNSNLLIGTSAFTELTSTPVGDKTLARAIWYYAFDYHQIRVENAETVLGGFQRQSDEYFSFNSSNLASFPLATILEQYPEREARLLLTLAILIIPIVLMLVFYIFMISQLKVQSELNEISVFQSRGAKRGQILRIYLLESALLGGVSLLAGPPLGLLMCRVLGASNGFLEFVGRKALPLRIGTGAMLAALAAVVLFIVTTLVPVMTNARISIVAQKRERSRRSRRPLWQRLFLDVILLGVSFYGLYAMKKQLDAISVSAVSIRADRVDFLLYLASTVFVIGAGLLFLRLYPWLVRMVARAGNRIWSPSAYAAFHQVGQRDGQAGFLMLFLILSLSIGLFSADSARTINLHVEDNTRCLVGADLRLIPAWVKYDRSGNVIVENEMGAGVAAEESVVYHEPDFAVYSKVEGIDHATRVLNKAKVGLYSKGNSVSQNQMFAVDPYDFAQTVWTRSDLNPYHINEYMNVMTAQPKSVILSTNLKDKLDVNVGDSVTVTDRSISYEVVVIAFVEYWPGYTPRVILPDGTVRENSLVIANLEYVFRYTPMEPYEVWMDRQDGATDRIVYDSIGANRIRTSNILSANQDIVEMKNDLILQGTNGMFSLGFIVSMLICAIGFLIYWILSIQGRVLQFGIFRAMGLSQRSIIWMLLTEQILLSGVAITVGLAIGKISGSLFVPLFRLVYSAPDQPIPFRVTAYAEDLGKILVIVGVILVAGFLTLARLILKIRIDQAVKLGEE